jgi:hypothetical protein
MLIVVLIQEEDRKAREELEKKKRQWEEERKKREQEEEERIRKEVEAEILLELLEKRKVHTLCTITHKYFLFYYISFFICVFFEFYSLKMKLFHFFFCAERTSCSAEQTFPCHLANTSIVSHRDFDLNN